MKSYSYVGPLIAIILPYIIFECFRKGLIVDPYYIMPKGHFYIVSSVAVLSTIIAIAIGVAGKRLRNIKVSFLALSYISLAEMFALHGLSTPGFLLHDTNLPSVASQLSVIFATIWLWLSSFPSDNKLIEVLSRRERYLLPVWIIILSIFGIISMSYPTIINFVPVNVKPLNWVVAACTIILNLIVIYRYYQSYRFSQFPLQISIVYSSGCLIVSQLIMVSGEMWRLSWWMYHLLLLLSMIVMILGLVKQYAVRGNFIGAIRALFTNDPFERITSCISQSVKALIIATEKKDQYTAGHTFRVTLYALMLGKELQLKPEQLKALAQGSLVHDVGKISIPDVILNKPSRLSTDERMVIEQHPVHGYEMCRELGFMKEELNIIRSHHEKWNGTGYPDQLRGEEISLLARIVAVADVYDALTSERAYRNALPHSEAINFLIENKGEHFDPICVATWVRLCERDPSVYQYPSSKINENATNFLVSSL
jgi:putative nucleotidyltransferase with HDIG domain